MDDDGVKLFICKLLCFWKADYTSTGRVRRLFIWRVGRKGVHRDLRDFITPMDNEDVDRNALGIRSVTLDSVLVELATVYRLG